MPPVSGALFWVRGLIERIEEPMLKLKQTMRLMLDTEEAKEVNKCALCRCKDAREGMAGWCGLGRAGGAFACFQAQRWWRLPVERLELRGTLALGLRLERSGNTHARMRLRRMHARARAHTR
eukprot:5279551-Pleurochrysis_carterae.AAC.3